MKIDRSIALGSRGLVVAVLGAAVAACGGGGGGDVTNLAITAANSEAVSHAAAAGVLSLSATGAVPLSAQSASADRRGVLAAGVALRGSWTARVMATLVGGLDGQRATASAARVQPLAIIGPVTEPCGVSGSISISLDDRDGDSNISVGDVVMFSFDHCRDTADETVDGRVNVSVLSLDSSGIALTADMDMMQLADITANHSLTTDGVLRVAYSTPSLTSSVENLQITARGAVTATVSTHLPFNDTLTLLDGWRQTEVYDGSVPPVAGNVEYGRSTTTVNGSMNSATAGGRVTVSTPTPIVAYGEDPYPRSGVLHVQGDQSALRLTALSVDNVRIELDANGDGTWEQSTTESWDWLI